MSSIALARQQEAFMSLLLDDSRELPEGLEARRVDIYRNAYRARLVDALRESFPRTALWVGADAFSQAAAHHVISHPPSSWTLDAVGTDFVKTLTALFSKDPEVAELAWLEWAMHVCFVSADAVPLDAAGFTRATAAFEDDHWAGMCLSFVPGTQQIKLMHRVDRLWRALAYTAADTEGAVAADPGTEIGADDISGAAAIDYSSDTPLACVVWRQGFMPACLPVSDTEGRALALMLEGAGYGDLCALLIDELGEDVAVNEAGAMLGRWLNEGMIAGVSLAD